MSQIIQADSKTENKKSGNDIIARTHVPTPDKPFF